MNQRIDIITLGVNDPDQAREFYEGASVHGVSPALSVSLGGNASQVALRQWDAVATEAGVQPDTTGFRAFTLSYILGSADEVDQILARSERRGGRVTKPPKNAVWGYSAYVTDRPVSVEDRVVEAPPAARSERRVVTAPADSPGGRQSGSRGP